MRSVSQWRTWDNSGTVYVFVKCPGCGEQYRLDHDISEDGVVSPSVECPGEDCAFHDTIVLACWTGPVVQRSNV